jgi:hypothetical protein
MAVVANSAIANVPNPKALMRANYMNVLSSYTEVLK